MTNNQRACEFEALVCETNAIGCEMEYDSLGQDVYELLDQVEALTATIAQLKDEITSQRAVIVDQQADMRVLALYVSPPRVLTTVEVVSAKEIARKVMEVER